MPRNLIKFAKRAAGTGEKKTLSSSAKLFHTSFSVSFLLWFGRWTCVLVAQLLGTRVSNGVSTSGAHVCATVAYLQRQTRGEREKRGKMLIHHVNCIIRVVIVAHKYKVDKMIICNQLPNCHIIMTPARRPCAPIDAGRAIARYKLKIKPGEPPTTERERTLSETGAIISPCN